MRALLIEAQRRPAGDTYGFSLSLNEGRSINSGDTSSANSSRPSSPITAQRRPEHKLRRHPQKGVDATGRTCDSLNEGRSINSGDTFTGEVIYEGLPDAQRRPEHKLRRHLDLGSVWNQAHFASLNERRSINSGDTCRRPGGRASLRSAQRRPEHKLRRHSKLSAMYSWVPSDSAQRRPEHKLRRHNLPRGAVVCIAVLRSTKAGA